MIDKKQMNLKSLFKIKRIAIAILLFKNLTAQNHDSFLENYFFGLTTDRKGTCHFVVEAKKFTSSERKVKKEEVWFERMFTIREVKIDPEKRHEYYRNIRKKLRIRREIEELTFDREWKVIKKNKYTFLWDGPRNLISTNLKDFFSEEDVYDPIWDLPSLSINPKDIKKIKSTDPEIFKIKHLKEERIKNQKCWVFLTEYKKNFFPDVVIIRNTIWVNKENLLPLREMKEIFLNGELQEERFIKLIEYDIKIDESILRSQGVHR
jgi:hypothetical protein